MEGNIPFEEMAGGREGGHQAVEGTVPWSRREEGGRWDTVGQMDLVNPAVLPSTVLPSTVLASTHCSALQWIAMQCSAGLPRVLGIL